jgi:hypothetical protein
VWGIVQRSGTEILQQVAGLLCRVPFGFVMGKKHAVSKKTETLCLFEDKSSDLPSETSSPSWSLRSTATAVLVLRMCLEPRDLEHNTFFFMLG